MTVVVVVLAVYYLTYVITRSMFPPVARLRDKVFDRWGEYTVPAYLSTCGWCASAYVAVGVVAVTDAASDVPLPGLTWAVAAGVTGTLLDVVDTLDHVRTSGGELNE